MATARSHNDDRDEFHFRQGSCNIILKQGDLLDENDVDALVIPAPDLSEGNPDNFVLFKSIYSKADEDGKREIQTVRSDLKLLNPQVISKNGRRYIFAVPPFLGNPNKAHELLKKTYTSCLNLAVKNNFRKIAFPTIGCGVIGFGRIEAARNVYSALKNFGQSKEGKNMDEIRLIIYDSGIWRDFTTTFMDLSDPKDAQIKFIKVYELLLNKSCSAVDSRFLNLFKACLHLIRVLDHQRSRIHLRCHRKEMKDHRHNDIHQ